MTHAELFALMERFDKSNIAELNYRHGEESILLKKATVLSGVVAEPCTAVNTASAIPASISAVATSPVGKVIKAPLVGTYYASPSPDSLPFVTIGKLVKKGDTVAVIEAMKMINEVPAPCDCIVEDILVENGALVGFADELLRISEK